MPAFLRHEHTGRDSSAASSSDGVSSVELQLWPQLTQMFTFLITYVRKRASFISVILHMKSTFLYGEIICRPLRTVCSGTNRGSVRSVAFSPASQHLGFSPVKNTRK